MADSVVRAMTDDGAFRVITARTTDTVTSTWRAQKAWGQNGGHLGELLTGAVLVALGLALGIFLWEVQGPWSIGLIPGLMGAALLLAWKIETRTP